MNLRSWLKFLTPSRWSVYTGESSPNIKPVPQSRSCSYAQVQLKIYLVHRRAGEYMTVKKWIVGRHDEFAQVYLTVEEESNPHSTWYIFCFHGMYNYSRTNKILQTIQSQRLQCRDQDSSLLAFFSSLMFYYLFAPAINANVSSAKQEHSPTHYRLGKNRPSSGNLVRSSRSALMLHAIAVMPMMTPAIIAVLAFQFAGCAYHPPEGDHTCLG